MGYLISDKGEVPGFSIEARRLRLLDDIHDYGRLTCQVDRKMSRYLEDLERNLEDLQKEDDESENDKKNTIDTEENNKIVIKRKKSNKNNVKFILAGALIIGLLAVRNYNVSNEIKRHTLDGITEEYYISSSGRKIWTPRTYEYDSQKNVANFYEDFNLTNMDIYECGTRTEKFVSRYESLNDISLYLLEKYYTGEFTDSIDIPEYSEKIPVYQEVTVPVYAFKCDNEKERIIKGNNGDSYSIKPEQVLGSNGIYYQVYPSYMILEDGTVGIIENSASDNLEEILHSKYDKKYKK